MRVTASPSKRRSRSRSRPVRDLKESGCKRLEVTTTQRGVYPDERAIKLMSDEERRATRNGTIAQDIRFTYQISYCRSGRFPKEAGG